MSHTPTTAIQFRSAEERNPSILSRVSRVLSLIFVSGPKVLFTSQITGYCAAFMIMLCAPSLLCCAMLTIPGWIFNSPEQRAYFYFSQVLNEDPSRWVVVGIAFICTLCALALPATMPEKPMPLRY